jgi:hypothetical protein
MKKIRYSFLLPFIMVGFLFAWGPRSHVEIAKRAIINLNDDAFAGIYTFCDLHRGEIYSGSVFPDWGLGGIAPDLSYHAHSMAFGEIYLEYLRDKYPDPHTYEAQRELAFLLGLLTHIYGDRVWHGGTGEYTALHEGISRDGQSEDIIEASLDIIIGYENAIGSFSWYWPYETIIDVYALYGDTGVTSGQLGLGTSGLEVTYNTSIGSGSAGYFPARSLIPWTYANYGNYFPGGFTNAVNLASAQIRKAWARNTLGAFILQQSHYNCGYTQAEDIHLFQVLPRYNTGGESRMEGTAYAIDGAQAVCLLKWELTGIDPTLYSIDYSKIYLHVPSVIPLTGITGNKTINLFRMNRAWVEGNGNDGIEELYEGVMLYPGDNKTCYSHVRYNSEAWASPGANGVPIDREGSSISSFTFTPSMSYPAWYSWYVSSEVNFWLSNPSQNFGIQLREQVNSADGIILFTASESKEISYRPMLVIYTSPLTTSVSESILNGTEPSFFLSPNPFSDKLHIRAPSGFTTEIFDLKGRRVFSSPHSRQVFSPSSDMPSGIFLVRFTDGTKSEYKRLVYIR